MNGNGAMNKQAEGTSTLNLIAMTTGAFYQFALTVVFVTFFGLTLI